MKNYRLYELPDFAMDDDFIRWIQEKGEHDNQFWKRWLGENPGKHHIVTEAKSVVELMPFNKKQFSSKDIEFDTNRLLQTIRQPVYDGSLQLRHAMHPIGMVVRSYFNFSSWCRRQIFH